MNALMLANVFRLLISVYYGRTCRAATASASEPTGGDYAKFAESRIIGYSALEGQVLDSLYKCCSAYDCPEIKRAMLDKRLQNTGAKEKARYVAFTVRCKDDQPGVFERLLAKFGYAGRLVLHKLFSGPSIRRLVKRPEAVDDTELRQEFRRVAEYRSDGFEENNRSLAKRVADEGRDSLLQLAEHGSGQDLAIYTVEAMDGSEKATLSSAFTELVDSWAGDAERRDRLLPVVIEFLQIALRLNLRCVDGQEKLQDSVIRHVYTTCDTERECFGLLRGFPSQRSLSSAVQRYVNEELNRNPSPSFVRKYLAHMRECSTNFKQGAKNFFRGFLPSVAKFHAADIPWKKDPERFNLISPRWLRDMFKGLRDSPPEGCDVAELMRGYMGALCYEAFICILLSFTWDECKRLADFMLEHQNAEAAEDYRQRLDRDRQRTRLNNPRKGVLSAVGGILKRTAAERPVLGKESQRPHDADQQQ
ncbi:hypothetical protein PAPHI01_0683 [Pancytospora philotis]|nr:hypothetical protein PAPHI01_0683 [Pancytospora philotis]